MPDRIIKQERTTLPAVFECERCHRPLRIGLPDAIRICCGLVYALEVEATLVVRRWVKGED